MNWNLNIPRPPWFKEADTDSSVASRPCFSKSTRKCRNHCCAPRLGTESGSEDEECKAASLLFSQKTATCQDHRSRTALPNCLGFSSTASLLILPTNLLGDWTLGEDFLYRVGSGDTSVGRTGTRVPEYQTGSPPQPPKAPTSKPRHKQLSADTIQGRGFVYRVKVQLSLALASQLILLYLFIIIVINIKTIIITTSQYHHQVSCWSYGSRGRLFCNLYPEAC